MLGSMMGRTLRRAPLFACVAALSPSIAHAAKPLTGPPLVTTGGVTQVRGTAGTLLGAINPRGAATTYEFQYGATPGYGAQSAVAVLPAGVAKVKVGKTVLGLLPGYHYRLVATNAFGTRNGRDRVVVAKASRLKFAIAKASVPTIFKDGFTLSGTLTGTKSANRSIELQQSPFPFLLPFAVLGTPISTNAFGAFSFHVSSLTASTQFRVSTLDPRPLFSPVVTQQVAPRVVLKVRSSGQRGLVRLYGTVTPAEVGAKVLFQLRKPARPGRSEKASERTTKFATRDSTVVKRATKTFSRFSAVVSVRTTGRYRAAVQVKKGPLVAGASATLLLHGWPSAGAKK